MVIFGRVEGHCGLKIIEQIPSLLEDDDNDDDDDDDGDDNVEQVPLASVERVELEERRGRLTLLVVSR